MQPCNHGTVLQRATRQPASLATTSQRICARRRPWPSHVREQLDTGPSYAIPGPARPTVAALQLASCLTRLVKLCPSRVSPASALAVVPCRTATSRHARARRRNGHGPSYPYLAREGPEDPTSHTCAERHAQCQPVPAGASLLHGRGTDETRCRQARRPKNSRPNENNDTGKGPRRRSDGRRRSSAQRRVGRLGHSAARHLVAVARTVSRLARWPPCCELRCIHKARARTRTRSAYKGRPGSSHDVRATRIAVSQPKLGLTARARPPA